MDFIAISAIARTDLQGIGSIWIRITQKTARKPALTS